MEVVYSLSNDTWGTEEREAIRRVVDSNHFTMGLNVERAENEAKAYFGSKYAIMVSSGSAANLLAIAAMVYSGKLNRGDEVLVTAVSWSTTYFPLEQMGLKIKLVDIDRNTLNIDVSRIEEAITKETKAIFAVNLLGNPNSFDELEAICKKYNLLLMEDNCESMGAVYHGKQAGTFGVFGTYSTFFSHHLCTMEGGFVVTDDEYLYHYMLSIRAHGWTRNLPDNSSIHTKSSNPFYESFCFVVPGFNLRPLDMEGALAVEQIKKLKGFIEQRRKNADLFRSVIKNDDRFSLQLENGESSWFGFALILKEDNTKLRDRIVAHLIESGIETRPIVAGNFAKQPVFKRMNASVSGNLKNADFIHNNGFFVGNHSTEMHEEINYLSRILKQVE